MLLHYAVSVIKCGPLWASSSMLFEGANNFLKRSIYCRRNVAKELANTSKVYYALDILRQMNHDPGLKLKKLAYFSGENLLDLDREVCNFITQLDGCSDVIDTRAYTKAKINGFSYTTEKYKKAKKTCSISTQ